MASIISDGILDATKYGILEGGYRNGNIQESIAISAPGFSHNQHDPSSLCSVLQVFVGSPRFPGTAIILVQLHEKSCQKGKRQGGLIHLNMSSAI